MKVGMQRGLRDRGSPDGGRSLEQPPHCQTACEDDGGNDRECIGSLVVMPLKLLEGYCENPELKGQQQDADHKRCADQPRFAGRGNGTSGLFVKAGGSAPKRCRHGSTPIAYSLSPFA